MYKGYNGCVQMLANIQTHIINGDKVLIFTIYY